MPGAGQRGIRPASRRRRAGGAKARGGRTEGGRRRRGREEGPVFGGLPQDPGWTVSAFVLVKSMRYKYWLIAESQIKNTIISLYK